MARFYRVPYTGTLTNAGGNSDAITIEPADDKPCYLVRLVLSQTTEVADAAEENLQFSIVHMTATVTNSNGTSVTPVKTATVDPAAGFTAEANGSTVSTTSGTTTVMEYYGWNIRASPLIIEWPEDIWQPKAIQGEALIVRIDSTPTDDITVQYTAIIREE